MRTKNDDDSNFAEYLNTVGTGSVAPLSTMELEVFEIAEQFRLPTSQLSDLVSFVFDALTQRFTDREWLCSRAIIAPNE